ncbi:MAG TPA: Ig-like domain-containing protein, partial [Myxococcaceae bacterium]
MVAVLSGCAEEPELGPPSRSLSAIEADATPVLADGQATTTFTVTVKDGNGNLLANQHVTVEASGSANFLAEDSQRTNASGVASFTLASTRAEQKTISATVGETKLSQSATVTFVAGPPVGLSFKTLPPQTVAGNLLLPGVGVEGLDMHGNPTALGDIEVSLRLQRGGSGILLGSTTARASSGVATFTSLSIMEPGIHTLVASAAGLAEATSDEFEILPRSLWRSVAVSDRATCALAENGSLWCWGMPPSGTFTPVEKPLQVETRTDWAQVALGESHACAMRTDGTLWCWGANWKGQLGTGNLNYSSTPVQVGTRTDWAQVDLSANHTCATRTDGTLWCWGDNEYGQLGTGSAEESNSSPVQVGPQTGWARVALGTTSTCATRTDGTLWCWGNNRSGQLGNGTINNTSNLPVQVGTETSWARVDPGSFHTCATRTDGTLWCWGSGVWGQLGIGDSATRLSPVQVGTGKDWAQVFLGAQSTCAARTDGSLWCWGSNHQGQVGDGTHLDRGVPARVGTATGWVSGAASGYHT